MFIFVENKQEDIFVALIPNMDSAELNKWLDEYLEWINQDIRNRLIADLDYQLPEEVKNLIDIVEGYRFWRRAIENSPLQMDPVEVPDKYLGVLKNIVLFKRKKVARELVRPLSKAINHASRLQIQEKQRHIEAYFSREWFLEATTIPVPALSKYIGIKHIEEFQSHHLKLQERRYDEKFAILQAPGLFYPDIYYYSEKCRVRNAGIIVGYIDIDNFKAFNTEFTEPTVDSELLPIFMNTLESHFYSHGFVYRYGGDEYTFILPNMEMELAIHFMKSLMSKIALNKYGKINKNPTISIGMYQVKCDNIFTEREIEEKANRAKNHAKHNGKNGISILRDDSINSESISKIDQ